MLSNSAYGRAIESLDIVVVEDNESMIRILRTILSAFGVVNIRTHNGCESALSDMLDQPPDLVIADWRMEPVNGLQFLRGLRHRTMGQLAATAVVMISGHASTARVRQAMMAGANQFLVKPISPAALLARLEFVVSDARRLVLKGNHYVVEGMDELFEIRPKPASDKPRQASPELGGNGESPQQSSPPAPAPVVNSGPDQQAGSVWEL